MALDRIKGITIELNVDGDKAIRKLDEFEKAANRVGQNLKDINTVLKLNPASTEALSQKQKALAQQVKATTEQLKMEEAALKQLEGGEQTEKTVKQQEKLKLQIEETKGKLAACKQEYQAFGSVGVQQLKLVGEQMQALGNSMVNTGRTLTRHVTAPIMALGGIAVKELADFEQGMAEVGSISMASSKDIQDMSGYARELAATTKFTAGEVTEAYKYMALAGWDTAQMMGGLEGVLNLVSASGEDLGRVSDIVTDGLTMFSMTAEESGRFSDVLAAAMSNANTNVDQLGEALKYIGPVAGQMGYQFEEVVAAMGNMADNGIKGSTAGTTLRNILTRLAKPTKEVWEAMDTLGVSLADDEGNMYSFEEVMQQLRKGFGEIKMPIEEFQQRIDWLGQNLDEGLITAEEFDQKVDELAHSAFGAEGALKAEAAAAIAGQRGMAGLMALVGTSDEDWNDLRTSINGASETLVKTVDGAIIPLDEALKEGIEYIEEYNGVSEAMRATMENTLSGQLTILKSQLSELAMQFGEVLMPSIKSLVEWVQNLVTSFQEMSPETKQMIVRIAAIAAAIGPLLLVGGKLVKGMGTLLKMPAKLTASMAKLKRTMLLLKTAISLPSVAILGIVAAIGVLIAAFATLWKNNENFRKAITGIWNRIKKSGEKLFKGLGTDVGALVQKFKKAWAWFTDKMAPYFINAIDMVARAFDAAVDVILGIVKVFRAIFEKDWKGLWEGVKLILKGALNIILSVVKGTFTAVKEFITAIWNAIGTWISAKLASIRDTFSRIFTAIKDKIASIWNAVKTAWVNVWNAIGTWIGEKLRAIRDYFAAIFTAIRDKILAIWGNVKSAWTNTWNSIGTWIGDKLRSIRDYFVNIFTSIRDKIAAVQSGIRDKVVSIWSNIGSWLSDKVSGIKEGIVGKFQAVRDGISSAFSSVKDKITSPFTKAWDTVKNAVQKIKDLFPLRLGNIFSGIKLPHFNISGGQAPWGIGGKGVKPSISIDWYKKAMGQGMVLNNPTIFGMMNGKLLGAGEAGSETVVGTGSLMSMIQSAVSQNSIDPAMIYEAVRQGASDATIKAYLSGKDITSAVNSEITLAQSYSARFQGV